MRKEIRLPVLVSLLLAGCAAGERHVATYERAWPASAVQTVELTDVDSNLQVQAAPGNQVTLVARVTAWGVGPDKGRANDGFFETKVLGDGTLRVGREHRKVRAHFPFMSRNKLHIDYELRVPAETKLDLRIVNGRMSAHGISGEASLVTVNGPIDIETAGDKQVYARTVNGPVRVVFLRDFAGARLKSINGGVKAILPHGASFSCSLSQVNGDFEASSAFPLRIHSHPGSRRVSGAVNGGRHELRISTMNGDVEVQLANPVSSSGVRRP
jgi:hypothetical protein